jgi:DNA polymerase-3 subunit epsilon
VDFVAVDVETANGMRGSVCAIGLAEVCDGRIQRTEAWLAKPPLGLNQFAEFNVRLHGISAAKVSNAPSFTEVLDDAVSFIDGRTVIAHNAAFDIGAIREGCEAAGSPWPQIEYGCSLVLSRRLLPLLSYRLPFVCNALGVSLAQHHDAGSDAEACAGVVLALASRDGANSLDELLTSANVRLGQLSSDHWRGCTGISSDQSTSRKGSADYLVNPEADPEHPLFGQNVVFTGTLMNMLRDDARSAVAAKGGVPDATVTKRTTILVIGDGFEGSSVLEFETGKAKKAAAALAKGQKIEILSENEFLELLSESTNGIRSRELR